MNNPVTPVLIWWKENDWQIDHCDSGIVLLNSKSYRTFFAGFSESKWMDVDCLDVNALRYKKGTENSIM
jgi:hypothetical protein